MQNTLIVLDNVRSAHNVGSIFRTADAAGVKKIYLCGITPAPTDRFGRVRAEIEKTALGATKSVAWEKIGDSTDLATDDVIQCLRKLKKEGFQIVAVEQNSDSVTVNQFVPDAKTVYIFGAEVEGVQSEILAESDMIVEIPMAGNKESLNVSVTVGITLFLGLKNAEEKRLA